MSLKRKSVLAVLMLLFTASLFAGEAEDIAKMGDAEWDKIILDAKKKNIFTETKKVSEIHDSFDSLTGKYMIFPELDFNKFVTDREGKKYFYYGDLLDEDLYVIKYDEQIQELFRKFAYSIGGLSDAHWEILGEIKEAYWWWGNVVRMDIVAMRVKGKATVVKKGSSFVLVGQDKLEKLLAKKEGDTYSDVPKKVTTVTKGLSPLVVAKMFFYYGSVEKNQSVWGQVLTKDWSAAKKTSLWRLVAEKNRTYSYVRTDDDSADRKKYFFQKKQDGKDIGFGPITVIKENGEWRVESANP